MEKSNEFVFADTAKKEDLGGGISRQILGYNPDLMMVKVWFEEGAIGYIHKHPHSQVTYIVSGEFDVNVGGVVNRMKAGDCTYMPPNVEHGSVCIKAGAVLDTFNPKRDDFLASAV